MDVQRHRDLLHHAAQRAEARCFFMASALAAYRTLHRMNDADLAAFLGCAPAALPQLALCRLPDASTPQFRSDVERIATYAGADSLRLASLLREVEATRALQSIPREQQGASPPGVLLAARERPQETDAGKTTPPGEAERDHGADARDP